MALIINKIYESCTVLRYSRVNTRGQSFEIVDCNTVLSSAIANLKVAIAESGALVTHDTYKILTASDGIEAIALYAQHKDKIKVVLMDMMLPKLDGLTAIRTIQKINPQVKIIATSGLMSSSKLALAACDGVKTFLSKPYTVKELLHTLQMVLS